MPDEFDQKLNQALATYSAAQPLAGLEQRILLRATTVKPKRQQTLWIAIATVATACLAMLMVPTAPPKITPPTPAHQNVFVAATSAAPQPLKSHSRHRTFKKPPPPLRPTEEELLLVRYVAADPEAATKTLISLNEPTHPLTIEPIKIESLESKN